MTTQLLVITGPDQGRRFTLADGQTLRIGRGRESDTHLTDSKVSRSHCRVEVDGGKAIVFDSGSTGGTVVNSRPIEQHALKPGDVIEIGETRIRYQLDDETDVTRVDSGRPTVADEPIEDSRDPPR